MSQPHTPRSSHESSKGGAVPDLRLEDGSTTACRPLLSPTALFQPHLHRCHSHSTWSACEIVLANTPDVVLMPAGSTRWYQLCERLERQPAPTYSSAPLTVRLRVDVDMADAATPTMAGKKRSRDDAGPDDDGLAMGTRFGKVSVAFILCSFNTACHSQIVLITSTESSSDRRRQHKLARTF